MTNSLVAGNGVRDGVFAALRQRTGVVAWGLAGTAMTLALLAPALWNGFPLIFPDTGGYFTAPIVGLPANGRSALYGLFLDAGLPLAFWPCVIIQSALVVWLIVVTLRVNGLGGRPWLAAGVVALLTVATSLPWFAGQLMPDVLFPAAALATYLLAYAAGQLARWERYALAAVIVFAIPSHMAAGGMCVAVIAAFWSIAGLARYWPRLVPRSPRLRLASAAVAAGIALCPVSNLALTGSFAFTPGGTTFLFGRLIEDGIIGRYLAERCPDATIRLCAYQHELPENADNWLWGNTILYKLGGWETYKTEEARIIRDTLVMYPGMHLTAAITAALEQFVTFDTEVSVYDNEPTITSIEQYAPELMPALSRARQQVERFDVGPLNYLHRPVAGFAIAGIMLALILRRRLAIAPEAAALCLTILLALAANAVVCGVFSHPVDRYQSRLVLLAPFAMAILVAQRFRPPVKA
jgi:hypothetical protein